MKRLVMMLVVGAGCLLAAVPAEAGANNLAAIGAIETLGYVDGVNVIDVAARHDRWIYAKRAMHNTAPLTPLQVAIAGNPALVEAIRATVWSFDLKSVYAARVEGGMVYLYLGEPPNK